MNGEKRVIVTNRDGLYYNLETEVMVNGQWARSTELGESVVAMVHENKLEDSIATIFRGPSIVKTAAVMCQCESIKCIHGDDNCTERSVGPLKTIYGTFQLCQNCADGLPKEYKL